MGLGEDLQDRLGGGRQRKVVRNLGVGEGLLKICGYQSLRQCLWVRGQQVSYQDLVVMRECSKKESMRARQLQMREYDGLVSSRV